MNKLIAILIILCLCLGFGACRVYASPDRIDTHYRPNEAVNPENAAIILEKEEEDNKKDVSICPHIKMKTDCLKCHTIPTGAIREVELDKLYSYPNVNFEFIFNKKNKPEKGYFILSTLDPNGIRNSLKYMDKHDIHHLVIDIHSHGGDVFDAWRTVGLLRQWEGKGNIVETRCYGTAMSAGFLIFASGTKGYRLTAEQAEFMWHEMLTFAFFKIASVSDKEDEAKVYRHLQDTAQNWLGEVSGMSKEEIDDLIKRRELWLRGTEMIKYGFADALLLEGR